MWRPTAVVVLLGVAVVALGWWRPWRNPLRLPERILLEDVVAELPPPPDSPHLEPGETITGAGARASHVAEVPGRVAWQVVVPGDAALRLSVAVEGAKKREPDKTGIRFWATVAGQRVFERVVNPAATRRDRRWFEEQFDLASWAGRPVEIVLGTEAERAGRPLAGRAGWSHVRIVRERVRERQSASPATPNVLVLLIDTLRADRLGCYGGLPSRTPNLDAVAAGGLLFEHAVAQASWTLPSVASIFTGLHPRSHGAFGVRRRAGKILPEIGNGAEFLADALVTWAEVAREAGITTAGFSTNPMVSRATNYAQGFETFVDFPWLLEGRNWTPAREVNAAFLDWLRANRDRRFLAYLHYMEPHDPYVPPPDGRGAPPSGIRPSVAAGWIRDIANRVNFDGTGHLSDAEVAWVRTLYDGEIRGWDAALGTLLAGLDALGVRDSTVLVITADHGEEFQEHGRLAHGSQLYEETLHVPLVLAGPGISPGRRAELVQGIDLFPTITALLGVAPPPTLPGRSLLAASEARSVISETARGIGPGGTSIDLVAVRDAEWKLIRTPALERSELYDLAHDPTEHDNRAGAPREEALASVLDRWQASVPRAAAPTEHDPSFRAKLRALGYAE